MFRIAGDISHLSDPILTVAASRKLNAAPNRLHREHSPLNGRLMGLLPISISFGSIPALSFRNLRIGDEHKY
jgi:hypothetical protein